MAQAAEVSRRIRMAAPAEPVELVGILTEGDRENQPMGGKGMFVKAIDEAVLSGRADLAAHSAKDVPVEIPEGLAIAAVLPRETVSDLIVSRDGWSLDTLPSQTSVATSALRRASQLKFLRPDVLVSPVRGNIETRLDKIENGAAALLAAAGINRLGGPAAVLTPRALRGVLLDPLEFLPAPAQGAILIISRVSDAARFSFLNHPDSAAAVRLERQLVSHLGADCSWPVGAWARPLAGGELSLTGAIFSINGKLRVREELTGLPDSDLPKRLADRLLDMGGRKILEWNRRKTI